MAQSALSVDKNKAEEAATGAQELARYSALGPNAWPTNWNGSIKPLAARTNWRKRDAVIVQKGRIEGAGRCAASGCWSGSRWKYASDFFGQRQPVFARFKPRHQGGGRPLRVSVRGAGPSGEATLSPGAQRPGQIRHGLPAIGRRLPPDLPVIIEVRGPHRPEPIRGRFPSNWELSTARAQEVVNYLIQQGIPPQRLAAVGMAEYHPRRSGGQPGGVSSQPPH